MLYVHWYSVHCQNKLAVIYVHTTYIEKNGYNVVKLLLLIYFASYMFFADFAILLFQSLRIKSYLFCRKFEFELICFLK